MNKKRIRLIFVLCILLLSSLSAAVSEAGSLSPEKLSEMLKEKQSFLLLDLRMPEDYSLAHIEGAVNADLTSAVQGDYETGKKILTSVLRKETGNERGDGETLVLACYTGNRYARAAVKILSEMGRDLSDVYILTGGNKAWSEYTEKKSETKVTSSPSISPRLYAWGDTFNFSKKRAGSSLDLYSALDLMGITTPCAFESNAYDYGFSASFADREVFTQKGDSMVKETKGGIYLISYPGGKSAWAEKRWPRNSGLTAFLPEPKMRVEYSAYDDSYLVVVFKNMNESDGRAYLEKLLSLFPEALYGNAKDLEYKGRDSKGRVVSFSFSNKALALEIQ